MGSSRIAELISGRGWLEGLSDRTRPLYLPEGAKDVNENYPGR